MILITGANGFLGQHLLRAVAGKGVPVRALYNRREPDAALRNLPGVEWMQADLLDIYSAEAAMAGITHIYHCAAIVSFDAARRDELIRANSDSTCNLVNAALDADAAKLLHVSSVAAIGRDERIKAPVTEAGEWVESKLNSAYAISKYGAEMEVWRGMAEGLDAVIINPGIILGEGDWNEGSAHLMQVADGEFPYYTSGINSFVDVADVVKAALALMHSDISEERFIVSAGNFAYKEIFTLMAEALGKKPPHIAAGPALSAAVWRWQALLKTVTGKEPSVTRETARTAQAQCFYDNSKLLKALPGFTYTPMPETITRMATAYKQILAGG